MKAQSRKRKGRDFERKIVSFFNSLPNWFARIQPGSGIYQGFPHDVFAKLGDEHDYVIECKKWKHGWRIGDKAMGQAEMLFIERDFGEPMIYMPARVFATFPWDKIGEKDEKG